MSAQAGPSRPGPSSQGMTRRWADLLNTSLTFHDLADAERSYEAFRPPDAPLSDTELAVRLARQEEEALQARRADHALALRLQEEERQGVGRARGTPTEITTTRSSRPAIPPGAVQAVKDKESEGGWLPKLFNSMASWFAQPKPPQQQQYQGQPCVICQDRITSDGVKAPCGHYYDAGCVNDLFQAATRDESLFPPRCCRQPIPLDSVRAHLSVDLLTLFESKSVEFKTKKRVYCSNPTCSRFLCAQAPSASFFRAGIMCCPAPGCGTQTCSFCKDRVEQSISHVCKVNADDQAALSLGSRQGWARCPGCDQLIELSVGCYHMTCVCKTEFCYLCRASWKTCLCPQWDEHRLLRAAEARVDAQIGNRAVRPPPLPVRPPPVPVRPQEPVQVRPLRQPPAIVSHQSWLAVTKTKNDAPTRVPPPPYQVAPPPYAGPTTPGNWRSLASTSITPSSSTSCGCRFRPPSSSAGETSRSYAAIVKGKSAYAGYATGDVTLPTPTETSKNSSGKLPDTWRSQLIRKAMDDLRVNHECSHSTWRYRAGGGHCESCGHNLPRYLFRCQGCQMLACNRCRRNRL